ncbi:hypothetical protein CEE37_11450 [candidate division LCP-89 bacterium B3_LCP]|uniref:histidine kinase n=1 Tax=candidate division LCP-89 bacterium B3_LCP TaxID=2012998 RepID=A0A532UVR8_UNCL8|nr:MAG: hypothetical protein CEE37_11450 [candidate division LCP-89 bacterium B3_LCP]
MPIVYNKNFRKIEVPDEKLYCINCGEQFMFTPDEELFLRYRHPAQECPGKIKEGEDGEDVKECGYEFHTFADYFAADKFFKEIASTGAKRIFKHIVTGQWFVHFIFKETKPITEVKWTTLFPKEVLQLWSTGMTEETGTGIHIIIPERVVNPGCFQEILGSEFSSVKPANQSTYLHKACNKTAGKNNIFCSVCRHFEYSWAERLGEDAPYTAGICADRGIHWIFPIWVEKILMGVITGGAVRYSSEDEVIELAKQLTSNYDFSEYLEKSRERISKMFEFISEKTARLNEEFSNSSEGEIRKEIGQLQDWLNSYEQKKEGLIYLDSVTNWLFNAKDPTIDAEVLSNIEIELSLRDKSTLPKVRDGKYKQASNHVEKIKEVTRESYRAKELHVDNELLHEVSSLYEQKHDALVDLNWCWDRIERVLTHVLRYLGIDFAVVLSNEKIENVLEVKKFVWKSKSTDEFIDPDKAEIGTNRNLVKFFQQSQEIFFPKVMRKNKLYSGSPMSIRETFRTILRKENRNSKVIAALPFSMSTNMRENKWAVVLLFCKQDNIDFDKRTWIYSRIYRRLQVMFNFVRSEEQLNEYIGSLDHEILKPIYGIESCRNYLIRKVEWKLFEGVDPYSERLLKRNLGFIKDYTKTFELITKNLLATRTEKPIYKRFRLYEEVIEPIMRLHGREYGVKRIKIDIGNVKEAGTMEASLPDLFQVFNNVFYNAVKYSWRNTVIRLQYELLPQSHKPSGQQLHLSVRNQGSEIPLEEEKTIFLFGVRGSEARSKDVKGIGYGLPASRTILRRLGGEIWFRRKSPTNVIEFHFKFPVLTVKEKKNGK